MSREVHLDGQYLMSALKIAYSFDGASYRVQAAVFSESGDPGSSPQVTISDAPHGGQPAPQERMTAAWHSG